MERHVETIDRLVGSLRSNTLMRDNIEQENDLRIITIMLNKLKVIQGEKMAEYAENGISINCNGC